MTEKWVVVLIEMFSVVKILKEVNCEKKKKKMSRSNFTPKSNREKILNYTLHTDNEPYS